MAVASTRLQIPTGHQEKATNKESTPSRPPKRKTHMKLDVPLENRSTRQLELVAVLGKALKAVADKRILPTSLVNLFRR